MAKLVTGYDVNTESIRVWADIPKRRNGEHNEAMLGRVLLALNSLPTPEAFDPPEPVPVVVPHDVAAAALRDGVTLVVDGDEIPGYRCATGACPGD